MQEPEFISRLYRNQLTCKETNLTGHSTRNEKYQGEIVISGIDESVLDGASEVQSFGLFDLYDMPPIDTWFYLTNAESGKRIIFAWNPQTYMHYADNAIAVNCMDCIGWLKDWYPEEYEQYYLSANSK